MGDALAWLASRRRGSRERDPQAARALLDALGIPDPPASVHVVGTNGKGSVTQALAEMARSHGHRVGRFMSPHVETLAERVAVDGVTIDAPAVTDFVGRVRPLEGRGALPDVGFFELTLALALEHFARSGVTLAVVEAGVGARKDATLALRQVVASVVTNVTLDHVETLGPTLTAIALDKAAAARPGVPLVTAARGAPLEVLRRAAARQGSPFVALADGDERFELPAGVDASGWPPTQRENGRVASATGRLLSFGEEAIAAGCRAPRPPARFEAFAVDDRRVILDGAHDPAAAAALAAAAPRPYVLVFGALARKQGAATFAPLAEAASWSVVTAAAEGEEPGPWPAEERIDEPLAALRRALGRSGPGGTVVVAGSLYLAGRLRGELRRLAQRGTGVLASG